MRHIDEITVRQARADDVEAIVALEKTVYGPLGTACYGEEYVRAWLEVHPEGLTVAEAGGRVVGYQYSQIVDFEFDLWREFATYDQATDHGYTKKSHRPDGNSVHSISLCSTESGAGRALIAGVFDLMRRLGKKYTVSQTRLAGFDAYLNSLDAAGVKIPDGASLDEVALWYALETARLVNGKIWPCLTRRPDLGLPPLNRPDPVAGKQLKNVGSGLVALLPGYMPDPQSRGYAVLLAKDNPDIP